MELGIIPKIDQFKDNKALEAQKVTSTNKSNETKEKNSLEEIQSEAIIKAKKNSQAESIKNEAIQNSKYEVVLTNTNFGYNNNSKDFYVKVERGKTENQYPTEHMMRVKAYMLSLQNTSTEDTKIQ